MKIGDTVLVIDHDIYYWKESGEKTRSKLDNWEIMSSICTIIEPSQLMKETEFDYFIRCVCRKGSRYSEENTIYIYKEQIAPLSKLGEVLYG